MSSLVSLHHEPGRSSPWIVRWFETVHQAAKPKRMGRLFRYQREAKSFQAAKQAELGGLVAISASSTAEAAGVVTLKQLLDEVTATRISTRSYATRESYRNTIDQLVEYFGCDRDITEVDQRQAEAFLASRKRVRGKGGDLSSWSIYHHRKHCRVIFGAAVEWRYRTDNPFVASPYSSAPVLRIRGRSRGWHHLTPEEFQRMLAQVRRTQRRAAYWLMYGCGLRPGEVYNLTVDRIDLVRKRVLIANRAATNDLPPFTVKADGQTVNGKDRMIPIPDAALLDLKNAMELAQESGGFIALTPERFTTIQGYWRLCRAGKPWGKEPKHRPWLNRDMLNNLLRDTKGYLRGAGLELSAAFTLHTFRKSYAQNHADAGTPPRTLAKLLGHSDVSVTLQFYNRVTDANELAAAETMNRLLANGPSPAKDKRPSRRVS